MAEGLPNPKSREQILSEMITEYVGLTGVNDLNTGSVLTQFFDVVSRSIARTSGDVFQILRDFSVDRATGEALNRIGEEERVFRKTSKPATGYVKVVDTSFEKISTKIYAGTPAPNPGVTKISVSDASSFPSSGKIYIGRGTPNIEGPLDYDSITEEGGGSYWTINLSPTSPTTKFHNISETVILSNKGTRKINVGTTVISPGTGALKDIVYTVSSAAVILDGETTNEYVQVVAKESGSTSNAPAGAVRKFSSLPFEGATVVNVVPFTTGTDNESDDDYRDRIKKERLSKGLGTALAVKNSILGAQAPDEADIIISNQIDTSNPDQIILYIDNGQGYEEKTEGVGMEFIVDSAIGGERNFQLATGGTQTSIAKAFLISSFSTPFNINTLDKLVVLIGGISYEHIFQEADFKTPGSVTAYEIVSSINNNTDLAFEATTADSGTKVILRAKTEDNEFIQMSTPTTGVDAGFKMGFSNNEIRTLLLYRNRELLNKNGRSAFVLTRSQNLWSSAIVSGDSLTIAVDGTGFVTYTFLNEDFIQEGQHSTVNSQNTLSAWVNVINKKITGITAEINGEKIKIISNLTASNRASIVIDESSTLVLKGMFSEEEGLSAEGDEADFEISRNTAQIKLKNPLQKGDSLKVGSDATKAEISSGNILGGQVVITDTAYLWLIVDEKNAEYIPTGVVGETYLSVVDAGGDVVRYQSSTSDAFSNVQIGDYVIVSSRELSEENRIEGRVYAVSSNTLDIKVTSIEKALIIEEGPIFFVEGFSVVRSDSVPQKIKIPGGVYTDLNVVLDIMNDQLDNATVEIYNNEVFTITTNTESTDGALFLVDFNIFAKTLNFTKNFKSESITTQFGFNQSQNKDSQFPLFVHGEINSETYADPPNDFVNAINLYDNLETLEVEKNGFLCFSQPYGSVKDVLSTECVEIKTITGTTVEVESSYFNKRNRQKDRYHLLNNYDFGHEDNLVVVLDGDFNQKTFNIPFYRTAITNSSLTVNPDDFRAYDFEGGEEEFEYFFGQDFDFKNYKCLMQAKKVIDPGNSSGISLGDIGSTLPATDEDAILFRSAEWGGTGEKIRVGYFYPTVSDQPISHVVSVKETIDIKLFLKSGASKSTFIDGTTGWNITVNPISTYEEVTYTYNGVGSAPSLAGIAFGDYVSISSLTEFDGKNTGNYKVYSSTPTSFTVLKKIGTSTAESGVFTLELNGILFFSAEDTTASEITDYVNQNLSSFITAELLDDNGTGGSGIIQDSTEQDLDYSSEYVTLVDGKNYLLFSDISNTIGAAQFGFKNSLDLPRFSTNTINAYSFNNGEKIRLVPTTAGQVSDFLNVLAVTGFTALGDIRTVDRNSRVQLLSSVIGEQGSVQVVGGNASRSITAIKGNCIPLGDDNSSLKSITSIEKAASIGFHSDQWVKVYSYNKQKKNTLVDSTNSIKITQETPSVGFTKIELINKKDEQRFFGKNRYHTRTLGRSFKIEKQGQFACVSWDGSGDEPFFTKNSVKIKESGSDRLTFYKDLLTGNVSINVDQGDMAFDEVLIGDLVTIQNRPNAENNGPYLVVGVSEDGKTLKINNPNAINELVSGSFEITDNGLIASGDTITIGTSVLTEGIDFIVGTTSEDTAISISSAISLISGIASNASSAIVTLSATSPGVSVNISTTSAGISASGTELVAPLASYGDIEITSEVQEGDSVVIGDEFDVLNRGTYRVIRKYKNSIYLDNTSVVEEEVLLQENIISIEYDASTSFDIEKIGTINRLKWGGAGTQPSFSDVRPGDVVLLGNDFNVNNESVSKGGFSVVGVNDDYIDYINVEGITESGIYILDVLKIHRESLKFKEYEAALPGDTFVITNSFLGDFNKKSFIVQDVLSEYEIIVSGNSITTSETVLGNNFNKIYLEEQTPYVGYKKIHSICVNPSNLNFKSVVFDSVNQFDKITEIGDTRISAMSKLNFSEVLSKGVDAYKYNTGLLAEANKIIYGDPRDNTTYPGVAAAGAEIFIKAPLVKRIEVSVAVRVKTGIPFSTITEEARSVIASVINSNPVGNSIAISDIVTAVGSITGIQAVAISSPQYDSQNDVIRVNAGEKSLVLDIISDISITKTE